MRFLLLLGLVGCATSVEETLNHHWGGYDHYTFTESEYRKARRFTPEAADELQRLGKEESVSFFAPNKERDDETAFACLDSWVRAVMWRDAFLGKIPEKELRAYTSLSGQDFTPGVLLHDANREADDCVKNCGDVEKVRDVARRYLPRCKALHEELATLTTKKEREGKLASLQRGFDQASAAAEKGRWKRFFAYADSTKSDADEATHAFPGDPAIAELQQRIGALLSQYESKRPLLAAFDRDPQIRALQERIRRIEDERRLTELAAQDQERIMQATSPRTRWDARGGVDSSPGNPEAHDAAQERWRLLHRHIADLDAEIHAVDERIDQRTAEIGL